MARGQAGKILDIRVGVGVAIGIGAGNHDQATGIRIDLNARSMPICDSDTGRGSQSIRLRSLRRPFYEGRACFADVALHLLPLGLLFPGGN